MNWDFLFTVTNGLAMVCWAVLILLPRVDLLKALTFYGGAGMLCLTYAVLLVLLTGDMVDSRALEGADAAGYGSIEEVRAIFLSDGGVVIGWTHYLAFDLFLGMWIASEADAKGFSRWLQAPILVVTFLVGPVGLLIWLIIREPAARRAAKARKRL